MAAPLRTPTKIIDWPRKSRAISSPSSATRLAMVSRDSNTLSSDIEHHLIHEFGGNRNGLCGKAGGETGFSAARRLRPQVDGRRRPSLHEQSISTDWSCSLHAPPHVTKMLFRTYLGGFRES